MSVRFRLAAYAQLLARYRAVFSAHWARRHDAGTGIFNEEEAEFLPAALSLQERPVSSTARWTALLLCAGVIGLLAWSVLGKIDIVVDATGKIISSQRTKTISSVDVASVHALHVTEGQFVRAGQAVLELDTRASDADRDKAVADAAAAALQSARSQALIQSIQTSTVPRLPRTAGVSELQWRIEQEHLDGQFRDFRARLERIDAEVQHLGSALGIATQQARDYKDLLATRDVSTHAYLEKEHARIDLQGQLSDARGQRAALIAQTRKDALDAMADSRRLEADARQDALRAASHSDLLRLVAPVDGTVQQLIVHTIGAAVPAATPLMSIVPTDGAVEVEADLQNKDIGFVREGQHARVKVDAFEYTRYGTLPGTVTHVSRDAIQDPKKGSIYTVKVLLDASSLQVDGRAVSLGPGMSVEVEIKTGTRRIIGYVLSPLLQATRESLRER